MPKEIIDRIAFDVKPSMRTVDDNGFLHVALTPISKAAVNGYYGREIPYAEDAGLEPNKIYFGLRDPAELTKGAATFNGLPLLFLHHAIDAETPAKEHVVGATGTDAVFDGTYLQNSLAVHDAAAIKVIEDGTAKELSCAYRFKPDFTAGEYDFSGNKIHYDFIMRDISGNHVALVPKGRAGHDVAVADEMPQITGKEIESMDEKVVLDSLDAIIKHFAPELTEEKAAEMKQAIDNLTAADAEPEKAEAPAEEKVEAPVEEKPEEKPEEPAEEKAEAPAQDAAIDENSAAYKAGFEAGKVVADSSIAEIKTQAAAEAKAFCKSLSQAAEKVKPLCGTVVDPMAFDSAEAIYEFALKQQGKKTENYDAAAYGAMVDMLLDAKPVITAPTSGSDFSDDELKSFENLKKISLK